jgi:CRISPR-associated protein Csd1
MLLTKLVEYSYQLDPLPRHYEKRLVRYRIRLRGDGVFLGLIDLAGTGEGKQSRGQAYAVPNTVRGVDIKPLLFADHAGFTFGLSREENPKKNRLAAQHQAYLELAQECARQTGDPRVQAVVRFLETARPEEFLPSDFDPTGLITFEVDSELVTDLPAVQQFWASYCDPANSRTLQCLVCGQEKPTLRILGKIKGIPGGQMSGTSIISANSEAFESYGLEQSYIAPTCLDCGERFTRALNALLDSEESRLQVGESVFVFWTRAKQALSFGRLLSDPNPQQVRDLIRSPQTGRWTPEIDAERFYAIGLSASGGRAVVRDWVDSTVGEVRANLSHWFARQEVVQRNGDPPRPQALWRLTGATLRPGEETPAATTRLLVRAALLGLPVPERVLALALQRSRATGEVTEAQAALIKLVFTSHDLFPEEALTELDPTQRDPGYLCGRLFATIEQIQSTTVRQQSQQVTSTVVDRFYGAASTAPASVFGNLLRLARVRLSQLEDQNPGAFVRLFHQLQEIAAGLQTLPKVLTLQQQGLFALGYYHQHAANRAAAQAAAARKRGEVVAEMKVSTEDDEDEG